MGKFATRTRLYDWPMPGQPPLSDPLLDPMLWAHVGFGAISLVLIGSGAAKVLDPSGFVRFLSDSSGRRVRSVVGRVTGGAEVLLGLMGLAVGGPLVAGLVALTYAAFTVVVAVALRRGSPSCGCFGAVSSQPRRSHLAMNAVSMLLAVVAAIDRVPPVADLLDGLAVGSSVIVIAVMLSMTAGVIFVDTR